MPGIDDHIAACRKHVEVGAKISVSGTKLLLDEIDWLRGLLADKDYIRCLADYNRGHLSYAGQIENRERRPFNL